MTRNRDARCVRCDKPCWRTKGHTKDDRHVCNACRQERPEPYGPRSSPDFLTDSNRAETAPSALSLPECDDEFVSGQSR